MSSDTGSEGELTGGVVLEGKGGGVDTANCCFLVSCLLGKKKRSAEVL